MPEKKIPIYQLELITENELGASIFNFSDNAVLNHLPEIAVPHRHDHYCCFFVESGTIDFLIDFQPIQVNTKSLLVSFPGQIHHFVTHHQCEGWILTFDPKLVDEGARMILEESLTKVAVLALDDEGYNWFKKLFELIYSVTHADKKAKFQPQLTRSLLDSFLYQASVFYQIQENSSIQRHSSRSVDIVKKFRQLLHKNYKTIKKPSEYAEMMNFSVSYLNDTVKEITGFPLTYFIQQEVANEAQRLLYYSEMSIKEIAYELGYEDDKYFIRLFGKIAGTSPANFRKNKLNKTPEFDQN